MRLYVLSGTRISGNYERIAGYALRRRLPSIYNNREAVEAGGLIYYGGDLADGYRRVAVYVDKILKGALPADLPIEQPSKFELAINLKTAKQIGVTIPQNICLNSASVMTPFSISSLASASVIPRVGTMSSCSDTGLPLSSSVIGTPI